MDYLEEESAFHMHKLLGIQFFQKNFADEWYKLKDKKPHYHKIFPIEDTTQKPQNHECDLRNLLDLDCEVTLPASTESTAELNFYEHDERMAEHIKEEVGEFPEEDFKQLQEDNKKLDELITQHDDELKLKSVGLKYIPGNPNNE